MSEDEIELLAREGIFHGKALNGDLIETHISWVILSDGYAFKVKKPLKTSFLDYSSLEKRRENAEKEINLNSRYSDIYLAVCPVYFHDGKWYLEEQKGQLIDYAVKMIRIDEERKMDYLLSEDELKVEHIIQLAARIAQFHQTAKVAKPPFDIEKTKGTFNDIEQLIPNTIISEKEIYDFSDWSDEFLLQHGDDIQSRVNKGLFRDVHGDLHLGNIFIDHEPIIFDCIEYNDEFRKIDLLYEIAFVCMDLESAGREDLSRSFLEEYKRYIPIIEGANDQSLFVYYKCLRANIRAKVHGLRVKQLIPKSLCVMEEDLLLKYWNLMRNYRAQISF
ncbi:phosphotransferase [Echinicola shivajiensis]|uniref:phosphotransferase n=1 Tax=Echinicola shivajiensis TaxID=1035916 RepID=UPI001BFC84B4|nr:phosphotransferase [Echinicola shivajiensis]